MRVEDQENRRFALLWCGAALALAALAPLAPFLAELVPPCPFKAVSGVACPFCGVTRAALALVRLEPLEALSRFPLPTVFWLAFFGGGLAAGVTVLLGRRLPGVRLPRWSGVALAAALAVNWIYSIATGV